MNKPLNRSAGSLIDVIIAVTILGIMAVALNSLIRNNTTAFRHDSFSFLADNLADEALNALQTLRDTNYLRFASDPDNCWNTFNVTDVSDCTLSTYTMADDMTYTLSTYTLADDTTYTLSRNLESTPLLEWNLSEVDASEDADLSLYTIDFDGDGTLDLKLYAESGISATGWTELYPNRFNRTFGIEYAADESSYDVTVTVTWDDGGGNQGTVRKNRTIENIY